MGMADRMIASTPFERHYPTGVTGDWFRRFRGRPYAQSLKLCAPNPCEEARRQWCTALNAQQHYAVVSSVLLEAGLYDLFIEKNIQYPSWPMLYA